MLFKRVVKMTNLKITPSAFKYVDFIVVVAVDYRHAVRSCISAFVHLTLPSFFPMSCLCIIAYLVCMCREFTTNPKAFGFLTAFDVIDIEDIGVRYESAIDRRCNGLAAEYDKNMRSHNTPQTGTYVSLYPNNFRRCITRIPSLFGCVLVHSCVCLSIGSS